MKYIYKIYLFMFLNILLSNQLLICNMDDQLWAFIIIAIIVIYMIFSFTSATVDEYIAEGITQLSEFLNLSDGSINFILIYDFFLNIINYI